MSSVWEGGQSGLQGPRPKAEERGKGIEHPSPNLQPEEGGKGKNRDSGVSLPGGSKRRTKRGR